MGVQLSVRSSSLSGKQAKVVKLANPAQLPPPHSPGLPFITNFHRSLLRVKPKAPAHCIRETEMYALGCIQNLFYTTPFSLYK